MSDDHALALPRGYILKDYKIEKVLGHGGFGITYLASETNLNRHVAIKEYLPVEFAVREGDTTVKPKSSADKEDYEWGLERFVQEAGTLAVFRHPAIVSVYRYFEDHGTAYMVMEYEEGESFAQVMREKRGKFTEEELRAILMPLLDGLAVVHKSGYLHRDIKPGNIYIRTDGSPVLLDFGAARHAIGNKSKNLTSIVTPGYAPMEQYFSDGNQGPWTDIYALAGILYQAVSGDIPPEAPARIKRDPFTALRGSAHAKRFSEPFLAAIDSALEVDEEVRPQTVAEWKAIFNGEAVPPAAPVEAPTAALRPEGGTIMPGRVSQRSAPPPPPSSRTVAAGGSGERKKGVSPLVWAGAGVLGILVVGAGVVAAVKPELFGGSTEISGNGTTGAGAGTTGSAGTTGGQGSGQDGEEARRRAEELRRQQQEEKRAQEEERKREEARRKAEDEARRKAEAEAKRKAEAKRRAEAEAHRNAQEEARRRAEEEARRKAEQESRNGDAEARRKAEEAERQRQAEERRKAAAEARRKAAEEAKRKREAERKRQLALGRSGQRCGSGVRALQGKFGRGDCPKITRAFAFALLNPQPGVPINWSNPAIGHRGTVLAYQAYQGRNGVLCRPFRQIMVAEGRTHAGNGAACLIGGRWTIVR